MFQRYEDLICKKKKKKKKPDKRLSKKRVTDIPWSTQLKNIIKKK